MTSIPASNTPTAVPAFLRGLDRRARLFALVQAGGDAASAEQALAAVARVFASEAGQWPIAQWPRQYWRLLLAAPALRRQDGGMPGHALHGIARLPAEPRAAVLLHLVAGLDDTDAAAATGIGLDRYQQRIRDALPTDAQGQPDVDVWRAWRAAAERELARMPAPAPAQAIPALSTDSPRAAAKPVDAGAQRHRRRMRWLWLGVLACALALVASFFIHPRGRQFFDEWRHRVRVEALPPAEPPKARFDAGDQARHPDIALLSAPRELAIARDLPLWVWLQRAVADTEAADPVLLPPAQNPPLPAAGNEPDPETALAHRLQRWDAAPARLRGMQRGAWSAWRALDPGERAQLRAIALRFGELPGQMQADLRARFLALPHDERHGAWLGARGARDWPRVAPLFAFAPASRREDLLRLLADADGEDIDAYERLAQITPPERREAVRSALLQQPPAQRRAWVLQQLAQ